MVWFYVCLQVEYGQGMLDRFAMAQKAGTTEEPLNLVSVCHIHQMYIYFRARILERLTNL